MDTIKINLDSFVKNLDSISRDSLYRKLWLEYVTSDVSERLCETCDKNCTFPNNCSALVEKIASAYVYDGEYDCNLSYWDNIDNLINKYSEQETRISDEN